MRKLLVLGFVGLLAQLIDGSLGMAYGVTSSTLLLAAGVAPAAASAAVHFSEIGTSLVSGFSHHKLGNVDWKTVSILAVPGFVGAFAGATFLSSLPADTAKPWVAGLLLGARLLRDLPVPGARRPPPHVQGGVPAASSWCRWAWSVARSTPSVAAAGARSAPPRCSPRAASSPARWSARSTPPSSWSPSAARSASSSRSARRASSGPTPLALLAGGVIAAPIAAWLVKHLAARVLGVAAGGLIVLTNTKTIAEALGASGTAVAAIAASSPSCGSAGIVWAVRQERRARRDRRRSRSSSPRPEQTIEPRPGGPHPAGPRLKSWRSRFARLVE